MAKQAEYSLFCQSIHGLFLIIFFFSISESVYADDVVSSCPWRFENNNTYEILCKLNSAGISSLGCDFPVSSLGFEFTSSTGLSNSLCASDYPCDLTAGTGSACRCNSSNNGIYTYSYTFVAQEGVHKGGSMKCTIDCVRPTRNITYATNGSCNNFQFDQNTSSTSSSNTTEQSYSSTSTPSSNVTEQTYSSTSTSSHVTEETSASALLPNSTETGTQISDCDTTCVGLAAGFCVGGACCAVAGGVAYYLLKKKPQPQPPPQPQPGQQPQPQPEHYGPGKHKENGQLT